MDKKGKGIPVIHYSDEHGEWVASAESCEKSQIMASYKNQLVNADRERLTVSDGAGDLHAFRNTRRYAAIADKRKNDDKKKIPRGLPFFLAIAGMFYILWIVTQS
jgi:hypothetical protein